VSIVTPVYNTAASLIMETWNSLKNSSFTAFEWVIVNDGSGNQDTLACLDQLVLKDERIRLIHHEKNRGLPAARNTGINKSLYDFLFFIDSDDLLDATAIEKFMITMQWNPTFDFVNSYVKGFGELEYLWRGGFHEGRVFLDSNRNTSCFMAKREVFDTVLFDESFLEGGEDWDFWLHAASKGYWGYTIPEYLILYRRTNSTSRWNVLSSEKALLQMTKVLKKKYGAQLRNFPERRLADYKFEKIDDKEAIVANPLSSPKNILFLFPWLELGGADKFNLDLVTGLKKKGWSSTIGCTKMNEQAWYPLFAEQTKDIFFFPHYSNESGFYKTLNYLIETRRPSVIFISNSMYSYYALPYIRQRFPGIPVVDYLHCEDPAWYEGGYPMFSAIFTKMLNRTFVTSTHLKQWCIPKGSIPEKIQVVYINVDTNTVARRNDMRQKIRAELGVTGDIPVLLYVARLTEQKQPLVLLASIEKLYQKTTDFLAVIIGDGPDKRLFIKKLQGLSSKKNILYLGAQSNDRVKDYMDSADIFFLPTAYEGIAMTIYEAMAKSLAIVAADVGGQAELVTKDCGILEQRSTPEKESTNYAEHLYQLINNKSLIYALGNNARQRVVRGFQLDHMIDEMDVALQQVIQEHETKLPPVTEEYLVVLNRLFYQQQAVEELEDQLSNHVNKILRKYDKEYRFVKKVYNKIKSIGNRK
jgi:glycosyltransferase involved in cell wall biosynthesis